MVYCVEVDENNVPFIQMGKVTLRLDMEELDAHYKERARNELRETPENVERGLARMRELIKEEEDFNIPSDDDEFLIKFLRPCKYYPESAFRLMKRFYKYKYKHPKIGYDLSPVQVRNVFDNEIFVFVPTRTDFGSRVLLVNAGTKWNPKIVSLHDMFRGIMVAIEIAMMEPKTQVAGAEVILNMEGFSLMHVRQLSPSLAKLMVDWIQECNPIRLKGIHVINQSFFFNMAYSLFKPFMGEKLKSRIFLHGNNKKSLFEKVSPEYLPPSIGGSEDVPEYPGHLLSDMFFYYEDLFQRILRVLEWPQQTIIAVCLWRSWAEKDLKKDLSFHIFPRKNSGKLHVEIETGRGLVEKRKVCIIKLGMGKPFIIPTATEEVIS